MLAREERRDGLARHAVGDAGIEDRVHQDFGRGALDGHHDGVLGDVRAVLDERELDGLGLRERERDGRDVADVPLDSQVVVDVEHRSQVVGSFEIGADVAGLQLGMVEMNSVLRLGLEVVGVDAQKRRRLRIDEEQDLALRVGETRQRRIHDRRHGDEAETGELCNRNTQNEFVQTHD